MSAMPSPLERVLHREQRGIEYQAAFDVQGMQACLTDELRPQVVTRRIGQAHVDQFVRLDEFGQAQAFASAPRCSDDTARLRRTGHSRSVTRSVTVGLEYTTATSTSPERRTRRRRD